MTRGILLLALTLPFATGWSQTRIKNCQELRTQIEAFEAKYSLYRFGGPSATLETVENQFGKPRLEAAGTEAVYELEGCAGRVLINAEGIAWMASFAIVPVEAPPRIASLEQLQELQEQIAEQKKVLEKLEASRAALVTQAAELAPTMPPEMPDCAKVLTENPADADALLRRAYCNHKSGHLPEAIHDYSEALRLRPGPLAYSNRALAYFATGQTPEALADLDRARAMDPPELPAAKSDTKRGPIKVKGYTRSDGTYVAPHTRTAPKK